MTPRLRAIVRSLWRFVTTGLLADVGMSGDDWDLDGSFARGLGNAEVLNTICFLFFDSYLHLSGEAFVTGMVVLWMGTFWWVTLIAPGITDYLELPIIVYGLDEKSAKIIYPKRRVKTSHDERPAPTLTEARE
jgi:hypothetical protein